MRQKRTVRASSVSRRRGVWLGRAIFFSLVRGDYDGPLSISYPRNTHLGGTDARPYVASNSDPLPHLGVRYGPSRRPVVCPPDGRPDREEPVAKRSVWF